MKIAIFADLHWSVYSSILRSRGTKYSTRLEHCIDSVNWFEQLSKENNCDLEINLGDFFDQSNCNAEELTAIKEIQWNDIPKKFLVGNHEMWNQDLSVSSMHTFTLSDNITVIDKPTSEMYEDIELCYLPYVHKDNQKSIYDYFSKQNGKRVIFSHNDIMGVQLGSFISQTGFPLEDIQNNCDLFLNGHIHSGGKVADKVINVGNLSGQNFSENAFEYDHCACILDTETLKTYLYENPYALNFYKFDYTNDYVFNNLKNNAVITVKCVESKVQHVRDLIKNNPNIIESRIILNKTNTSINTPDVNVEYKEIDALKKFQTFIMEKLGSGDIVLEEIQEVIR